MAIFRTRFDANNMLDICSPHRRVYTVVGEIAYTYWGFCNSVECSSSYPSAAYMRQWIGYTLVPVIICHLFGAKPIPESLLAYCQLDPWEQISMKSWLKFIHFIEANAIENVVCKIGGHFVQGGYELNENHIAIMAKQIFIKHIWWSITAKIIACCVDKTKYLPIDPCKTKAVLYCVAINPWVSISYLHIRSCFFFLLRTKRSSIRSVEYACYCRTHVTQVPLLTSKISSTK